MIKAVLSPSVALVFGLMTIVVMMILPVPATVLDFGLACSFALAILIFTLTLFIERPLDFSSFPTILLTCLMLRLSLNVSSTKLIIGQGHTGTGAAGGVIEGFAAFVMGGSVFLGLVVFLVLLIVNFMVITKGATRMAEVGARFALDGMPGKQLAIDSDVASGALTHEEAKARRELEQQETTFYGSLDGASKFVKGDAVAGLLITALNLVAGLIVGLVVHDMPLGEAFETFAILTVGDGLVTQIPAVIVSVAAALLLSRGGARGSMDSALFSQLAAHPTALFAVAVLLLVFAAFPGLPAIPFGIGALLFAALGYWRYRRAEADAEQVAEVTEEPRIQPKKTIGELLELDDIHVEFAPNLVSMVLDSATGLDTRIENMRRHVAASYGLVLPEIRLTDQPSLPDGTYSIRLHGVEAASGSLRSSGVLALLPENGAVGLPGEDTTEPVYQAPARWISIEHQEDAAVAGVTVVTATEILATHLLEVIKKNLGRLLTLKALKRLLLEMTNISDPGRAEANRKLLDELVPDRVPMDVLHAVLRLLLEEQVSIRNLPLILESIAEARTASVSPEAICEHVRQRLGFQIVAELKREDGSVPLLQLAPEWDEAFEAYSVEGDRGQTDIGLPPELFNQLAENVATELRQTAERGVFPAVVASAKRRRFLRTVLRAKGLFAPVLSFEEIGFESKPALVGVVPA